MWVSDHKEGWVPKNWCFQTVVLEKTLESPTDCKEIKPVNPKGNQPWIFTGRTVTEAENPAEAGHLMWRADSFEKILMLGKIAGRRRRGWQRMRWLDGITDSTDIGLGGLWVLVMTGRPGLLQFMGSQRIGHDWATETSWTPLSESQVFFIIYCENVVDIFN